MERRKPKIQLGRRKTDTPAELLRQFKTDITHHLRETIEEVVNNPESGFRKDFNDYVKGDTDWKIRAEPVVKAFENTSWALKIFIGLVKFLGVCAAALTAMSGLYLAFHKYMNK
jgi:hypothetical protein